MKVRIPKRLEGVRMPGHVPSEYVFLVMTLTMPGSWGKGPTLADAVLEVTKRRGGLSKTPLLVMATEPESYVDDMGRLCWHSEECKPVELYRDEVKDDD